MMKVVGSLKKYLTLLYVAIFASLLSACNNTEAKDTFRISFDEGKGSLVRSSGFSEKDYEVDYVFKHSAFDNIQEPIWSEKAVKGKALLFDGNSSAIKISGGDLPDYSEGLFLSIWIAPRAFEWDDPYAESRGSENVTALVSQLNQSTNEGFILGYQRFGKLYFKVGNGKTWFKVWGDGSRLEKYSWNHVVAQYNKAEGRLELYLNAKLLAFKNFNEKIAVPKEKDLLLGRSSTSEQIGSAYLQSASGLIDEFSLSPKFKTSHEIKKIYESAKAPNLTYEDVKLSSTVLNNDKYRPKYHAAPKQNWMNEPHAPLFYSGKYHLFFQQNILGPYWRNINWGHFTSDDLVSWEMQKEAITPTENSVVPDGVWSGGATKDVNGVPLLFFTAGNDAFRDYGLISNQNIGLAYPKDLEDENLLEWEIYPELAIKQTLGAGTAGEFRDPHIWQEAGVWNMLLCSAKTDGEGGTALLYQTEVLELKGDGSVEMDWKLRGPVYEMENQSIKYGKTWELPIILPLKNESGNKTKHIFIFSPAPAGIADNSIFYFLGDFSVESGKFVPDESFGGVPRLLDYGANVFTGPSAFYDENSGKTYLFSIMQGQRTSGEDTLSGWAHNVGLSRELFLNEAGNDVKLRVVDTINNLESDVVYEAENVSLGEFTDSLKAINLDTYKLELEINVADKDFSGLSLVFNNEGKTENLSLNMNLRDKSFGANNRTPGKANKVRNSSGFYEYSDFIHLEVYVDKSLLEVFLDESRSISIRTYPDNPSTESLTIVSDNNDLLITKVKLSKMSGFQS